MAKKSRRVRRKERSVRLSATQMAQPGMSDKADAAQAPHLVPKVSDLREEYRYVITDLKRIGIIAVAMLAVLIALALILT